MSNASTKGYFGKVLAMDCETSGLAVNSDDPSIGYQAVSWGLVVADASTLKHIDELYVEIKWNGESKWDKKAEAVHGLTKQHLDTFGLSEEDALVQIANFVYKYWDSKSEFSSQRSVRCLGHNVATFDIWFMRQLFRKFDLEFKSGNRFIDTSTVGWTVFDCFNSDDVFELVGVQRAAHNALEDAKASLAVVRTAKTLCRSFLED
jgi:phenylpyruvate tautomerase PptA (4-oxalocrotonate tautomerase family)